MALCGVEHDNNKLDERTPHASCQAQTPDWDSNTDTVIHRLEGGGGVKDDYTPDSTVTS